MHQERTAANKRKDKYAKVAAKPVPTVKPAPPAATMPTFADIQQLQEVLMQCTQQMKRMQWDVTELKQLLPAPTHTLHRVCQRCHLMDSMQYCHKVIHPDHLDYSRHHHPWYH